MWPEIVVHLVACGVKVAGVGECPISVVPGEVQIRFIIHICLLLGLLSFLTKWRSCSRPSWHKPLGKSKARMHSTHFHTLEFQYCHLEVFFFHRHEVYRIFAFSLINCKKLMGNQLKTTTMIPTVSGWLSVTPLSEEVGRRTSNNQSNLSKESSHSASFLKIRSSQPPLDDLGNQVYPATSSAVWLHRLPPGQETPLQTVLGLIDRN